MRPYEKLTYAPRLKNKTKTKKKTFLSSKMAEAARKRRKFSRKKIVSRNGDGEGGGADFPFVNKRCH